MTAPTLALQQPIRDGGIRTINFFNGRMLTGKDMGREQQARREAVSRLGQAVGHGVVSGLTVELGAGADRHPIARISQGLAVNRNGQTLALAKNVEIALTEAAHPDGAAVGCLFGDCAPAATEKTVINLGQQLYMLTIAPAFASEGRAVMNSSGDSQARCNTDATVEAVQFRLIEVNADHWNGADFSNPQLARNRIAYGFFGDRVRGEWAGNLKHAPLSFVAGAGLAGAEEVPLALVAFGDGFAPLFIDMWSVRRSISQRDAADAVIALSGSERPVVGEAMFRQFHDQWGAIQMADRKAIPATFKWLPPAGVMLDINDADIARLFAGMTVSGPHHIDQSAIEPLIRESFTAPAIDTSSDHAVWLYRIAQSQMPGLGSGSRDTLLFASGHLPYRGDARFNLNYWDYANFALTP